MNLNLKDSWAALWAQFGVENQPGLWVFEVFVVVFITLLANLLLVALLKRIGSKLKETVNLWDDVLVDAVRKPAAVMVWLVGISWAAELVDAEADASLLSAIAPARDIGVILLLAWFLIRLIRGGERVVLSADKMKKPMDETTAHAIGKLLRASVIITAVLVMLQTLGYSISGVLAFGGIGGIAIGFAAKDLLANFFGGLMIYLDRPFAVGDWVRSPDQEIEGVVEYIGWRQTRIRTFDKRPLYVPNSTFANISVENPSRMTNRRIFETIGLRYDDIAMVKTVVDDVRTMLQSHPDIDQNQTMIVHFNSFNAYSVDFFIYTFTKTTEWIAFHRIKEDVLLKIAEIVESHGAEFAFPTSTVHLPDYVEEGSLDSAKAAIPRKIGAGSSVSVEP